MAHCRKIFCFVYGSGVSDKPGRPDVAEPLRCLTAYNLVMVVCTEGQVFDKVNILSKIVLKISQKGIISVKKIFFAKSEAFFHTYFLHKSPAFQNMIITRETLKKLSEPIQPYLITSFPKAQNNFFFLVKMVSIYA